MKMKPFPLSLPQELKEQLEKEAKLKGLSLAAYIRMILYARES